MEKKAKYPGIFVDSRHTFSQRQCLAVGIEKNASEELYNLTSWRDQSVWAG